MTNSTELQQVKVPSASDQPEQLDAQPTTPPNPMNRVFEITVLSKKDGKWDKKKVEAMDLAEARRIALDQNNITVVEVGRG